MRRMAATVFVSALALAAMVLATPRSAAAGFGTYLALGDSLAFGEDSRFGKSDGDRGYVGPFAQFLAGQNGGFRPHVVNLGVDGETTTTFLHGGPQGPGPIPGMPAPQLNLNYTDPSVTQFEMMHQAIADQRAAGHTITDVSVQLGANDLLSLLIKGLTPAQIQAEFPGTFAAIQGNLAALLTDLHAELPDAHVLVMGYFNPYNISPNDPTNALVIDPAVRALNGLLAQEAAAFQDRFVDVYPLFVGKEGALTHIAAGDVHPTREGYDLIEREMERVSVAAVPEPAGLALLGLGGACLLGLGRLRRRASAA